MKSLRLLLLTTLLAACAPREVLLPAVGIDPPALRDFPADFQPPQSHETAQVMPGFGGGGGGLHHTPVIFIHGNTVSSRYWLPDREYFRKAGYSSDELWSLGYGWDNVRYFDANDLSVPSVERIVNSVTAYLEKKTGKAVPQVDIIGHSLGVTLVRQWMKQTNSWHRVRNFIGACGANQGAWTAWSDSRGQNRSVNFELTPGGLWLQQLNRGGETPGPTRYMTIYDGTGWADVFFPAPWQHGSALKGAYNLPFNVERGTHYDHLALPREPEAMQAMIDFLRKSSEPFSGPLPQITREGSLLRAGGPEESLHCVTGGDYPSQANTRGSSEVQLQPGQLYTCYAHNNSTQLSSPMARYKGAGETSAAALPTISATPAAGPYEQPQRITLGSSDPEAFIVYTTSGTPPNSGSPLYTEPVYVAAPVKFRAIAIAPDGRQSAELQFDYDISLELIDARHTLQRQFDDSAPVDYAGKRKKGR